MFTYGLDGIDDGELAVLVLSVVVLLSDERPDLVEVDGGLVELLGRLVEVAHTDLTKVTRMVPRRSDGKRSQTIARQRQQEHHERASKTGEGKIYGIKESRGQFNGSAANERKNSTCRS